jgi:hypothetical protein
MIYSTTFDDMTASRMARSITWPCRRWRLACGTSERRGGTIAFNFYDRDGQPHDARRIEALVAEANISLRTGCFCNPGAGEMFGTILFGMLYCQR